MSKTRCDEVIVQIIVRTYDDVGRPIREQVTQPVKVLRNAETLDFWSEVDKAVKVMQQPAPAEPPKAEPPEAGPLKVVRRRH